MYCILYVLSIGGKINLLTYLLTYYIHTCVAFEGFVLYAGGDYALHLDIMLLV